LWPNLTASSTGLLLFNDSNWAFDGRIGKQPFDSNLGLVSDEITLSGKIGSLHPLKNQNAKVLNGSHLQLGRCQNIDSLTSASTLFAMFEQYHRLSLILCYHACPVYSASPLLPFHFPTKLISIILKF
jgi:hypothetical protein